MRPTTNAAALSHSAIGEARQTLLANGRAQDVAAQPLQAPPRGLSTLVAALKRHSHVVLEDLHIAGMLRNRRLARHIADSSWGCLPSN